MGGWSTRAPQRSHRSGSSIVRSSPAASASPRGLWETVASSAGRSRYTTTCSASSAVSEMVASTVSDSSARSRSSSSATRSRGADVPLLERLLHGPAGRRVDDWQDLHFVLTAIDTPLEHLDLVVARGVADAGADEEAVELRLGQWIRPFVLDRVLRRQHDE